MLLSVRKTRKPS